MTTARNGLIDCGRFAAALGIVWFHSQAPGKWLAYIALPFFLVLLSMPSSSGLATRARRLLLPFATWSLVFGLLRTLLAVRQGGPAFGWWEWHMLLSGTWIHLWFLPFAFLTAIIAPWFKRPLVSLGAALLTAVLLSVKGTPDSVPFGQWSFGVIPVMVGIAYYSQGLRLAVITLLASWLVLHFGRPLPDNFTILAGTALALLVLSCRLPATDLSDWCARLSVWIYLAHPLIIVMGQSMGIARLELGLFALVGSIILAQLIETAMRTARKRPP